MDNTNNSVEKKEDHTNEEIASLRTFCWSFVRCRDDRLKKEKRSAVKSAVIYTFVLVAVFALLCIGVGVAVCFGTV